jgi:hypothetical protein
LCTRVPQVFYPENTKKHPESLRCAAISLNLPPRRF